MSQPAEPLAVTNPATGDFLDEVLPASELDIEAALVRSQKAQLSWDRVPRHQRSDIMLRYVSLLFRHKQELAELLTAENGKPIEQAKDEVDVAGRIFKGFAERVLSMSGQAFYLDSEPGAEEHFQITKAEPLGVVAAITPFNFPLELYAHKVAPAIAVGNTVVLKPSEETPLATRRAVELLFEAGLHTDVVQLVFGGAAVGRYLAEHPAVAAISLTGSTEAGISVATGAAKTLKKVLLELGGNDPMLILSDANLDLAVEHAVLGRSLANGQCCCANKRVIVQETVLDEVTDRLVSRFGNLQVGDPAKVTTEIGPLIKKKAAERVKSQVNRTVDEGARIAAGGGNSECFYEPTVLVDVKPSMSIARDLEVFGPVIAVMSFESVDEATQLANQTSYGLSSSIFSKDYMRALAIAHELEAGHVVINGTGLYQSEAMPWGGYKLSGVGREGLNSSLEEYVQSKTITFWGAAGAGAGSSL